MKANDLLPPHINLIGDSLENFYALGLKDKNSAPLLINQMKSLIETPWSSFNKAVFDISTPLIKHMFLSMPLFKEHISSYAEGLNRKPEEIALCYILPEVLSSMDKWLPSTKFGCSSFFALDQSNGCPMHGRILDFPLIGSYDKNSRTIKTQFKNSHQLFGYSSAGLPHPSLTTMTDQGISFALHQKFTNKLHLSGTPVFELVYQMLSHCDDLDSTLEFLKHAKTLTTWSFHMSFQNGDILAVDISGEEKNIRTFKLQEKEILYFGNKLLTPSDQKRLPYGFDDYNNMRETSANTIISKLKKKSSITDIDLLMAMATPAGFTKTKNAQKYNLSPITPSSLDIVCMTPKIQKSISINTSAPKFYQGSYLENINIFKNHTRSIKKSTKPKTPKKFVTGISFCMQAQAAIDNNQIEEAYHYFQMAIQNLDNHTEKTIAIFFFNVLRFCHEKHSKVQNILLSEFVALKNLLPPYLADHNLLFIMRLEIILNKKTTVERDDLQLEELQCVYNVEMKIPSSLLHITITKLLRIRYDTLDIIYPHAIS